MRREPVKRVRKKEPPGQKTSGQKPSGQKPVRKKASSQKPSRQKKSLAVLVIILFFIAVALLISFFISSKFHKYTVTSGSMEPGIMTGDTILISEFGSSYEVGDIIVFNDPDGGENGMIKRIIGVPGDNISVQDGVLYRNGQEQSEYYVVGNWDYWQAGLEYGVGHGEWVGKTLGEDEYYVMGDNRKISKDSRYFGAITKGAIVGKAIARTSPTVGLIK